MRIVEERDPQTYAIIGAAMEIHRQLGHGFLEAVYQDAAVIEFPLKQIPFEKEVALPVKYKNILLPTHYRADLFVFPRSSLSLRLYPEYRPLKKHSYLITSKQLG